MKKVLCVGLLCAVGFALSGCPILNANIAKNVIGEWQWIRAAAVLSPETVENIGGEGGYANETVANDFANEGRKRKTITFSKDGNFTYLEETWRPDREANRGSRYLGESDEYQNDGGVAVEWDWRQSLYVEGTYQTGPYEADGSAFFSIPGLDTELFVDVATYTTTYRSMKDKEDAYNRTFYQYDEVEVTSDASNPLGIYALLGMNAFDQLLVGWDMENVMWKDFNENVMGLEVYRRLK